MNTIDMHYEEFSRSSIYKFVYDNPNLVPFKTMPYIADKLTNEDYICAFSDIDSYQNGLMTVIHMNIKHADWINIRYSDKSPDLMAIYTKNGWKECVFDDIVEILEKRINECAIYAKKNYEIIFKDIINI